MSSDRKDHWDEVYRRKLPAEVSWYQKEPALSLKLIGDTGIAKDDPLIDVGAGESVLVDRLADEGYTALAVLDVSSVALARVRERLGEGAANVEWFEADATEFVAPHPFALWHDRAAFHFLTDRQDRQRYVNVVRRSLSPGGHLIIAAFAIGGPTRCSGLDVVQYDSEKLCTELGEDFQFVSEAQEIQITPANKKQRFGYFQFAAKTDSDAGVGRGQPVDFISREST